MLTYPVMTNTLSPIVQKLEREIAALSFEEKLWLLAQIAQQIQPKSRRKNLVDLDAELLDMANDPEIQRELAAIDSEFAITHMDGLN